LLKINRVGELKEKLQPLARVLSVVTTALNVIFPPSVGAVVVFKVVLFLF
jgi:hypothetical protein